MRVSGTQAAFPVWIVLAADADLNGGYLGYAPNEWGPGGSSPAAMNGILDEVRLASAERSAGWIATEYANQRAPLTFYAVGSEQPVP